MVRSRAKPNAIHCTRVCDFRQVTHGFGGLIRPHQRIGDDVDVQIQRLGGIAVSLRQMRDWFGRLYFVIGSRTTGLEVWRTADGSSWEQIGFAGLGDSNNNYAYWDNSVTVSGSRFFVSTCDGANGGEVWLYLTAKVYLPLVVRSH